MTDTTTPTGTAPREVRLASRPVGWPTHEDFSLVESEVPALADGQIRVRNTVMSVDPYMRGRMSAAKSYAAPYELGAAMTGGAVGVVEETRAEGFAVGDHVLHGLGWREVAVLDAKAARTVDAVARARLGLPGRARDDRPHGVRRTDPDRRDQARGRRVRLRGGRRRRQRSRPDRQGARREPSHRERRLRREGAPRRGGPRLRRRLRLQGRSGVAAAACGRTRRHRRVLRQRRRGAPRGRDRLAHASVAASRSAG